MRSLIPVALCSVAASLQLAAFEKKVTLPITRYSYPVTANLDRAAAALQTVTIAPGEIFSLNAALGPRNAATGYRMAPVFGGNGVGLSEFGGGLCMVSSILYNLALTGGLEILERHPHQRLVRYTAPGLDAALDFGRKDLRVRNPHAYVVSIRLTRHGRYLTAELSGAGALRYDIRLEREVAPDTIPGAVESGFRVRTLRIFAANGGAPVRREILSQDTFLPIDFTAEGEKPQ